MSETQKKVFKLVQRNPHSTTEEIAKEIGVTDNGDVFVYDNAMVIKTKDSTYTISKGCEVDPSLYIRNNEKIDVPYSVRTERDNFSDTEHKMRATVSRDYIFI